MVKTKTLNYILEFTGKILIPQKPSHNFMLMNAQLLKREWSPREKSEAGEEGR
jgi:hypothetical protein